MKIKLYKVYIFSHFINDMEQLPPELWYEFQEGETYHIKIKDMKVYVELPKVESMNQRDISYFIAGRRSIPTLKDEKYEYTIREY